RYLVALAVLAGSAAMADTYRFEWQGAGGYSMRGAVAFDPEALETGFLLTEADVDCFEIEGFRDGVPIGRWALGMITEETTWILTFDPSEPAFVASGPEYSMPQAWNMDGRGENCGEGGFGFNLGSFAQDLCLDNTLIVESQVPPPTDFPAIPAPGHVFEPDACRGVLVIS
ncbi:MAG: hypothetical protein AAF914_08255, partial [Pseudomonadota bacterium]